MTVYTFDLIIIVALLLASMGLTVATGITLSGRIRDLRDEVLAAELARDELDRRTLGDPRSGGNDEDEPRGRGWGDW